MGLRGKAIATEVVSPILCVDRVAGTKVANEMVFGPHGRQLRQTPVPQTRGQRPATSRHLLSGRLVEMRMSTNTSSEHHISDLDFLHTA